MKKKRKFTIKSKHLIVGMTIFCIGLIIITLSSPFVTDPIRNAAGFVIRPFQNGINTVGNWLTDKQSGFKSVEDLSDENKTLQAKIDELTTQNNELVQNQYELDRLQELYNLDKEYSEYNKVAAQIISKDPGNWYNVFVINRGSDDGLAVDMNVIAGSGLVGIVTEVGANWATVRSIIDDESNVSSMIATTSDTCIVTGDLTLIDQGMINFSQLTDKDNVVQEGDKLVTSNVSEKFLTGILIGYINQVTTDSNNLTKSGTLTPAVDFKHLREVLVITDLKQQKTE
ncbi:MAG: rod shape-determining protein MreC [Lachnospiraceae bacterium]|nr:rod shape-determining protein MreC [Lachnospiraceae bacterium]